MASVFGHFISGFAVAALAPPWRRRVSFVVLIVLSAMVPDVDVISFRLQIPYEHMLGHRGLTHSIPFAFVWALLLYLLYAHLFNRDQKTSPWIYILFLMATLLHSVLDAMTTGGLGVAFFAPFSDERYFLPWRYIKVSPLHLSGFLTKWGQQVIMSEIKYVLCPTVIIIIISSVYYRFRP